MGYAYWQNGDTVKANGFFNKQIASCIRENELGRSHARTLYTYFDLATLYAFKGEKEEAIKNLKIFNQRESIPYYIIYCYIKNDPMMKMIPSTV